LAQEARQSPAYEGTHISDGVYEDKTRGLLQIGGWVLGFQAN